MKGPHIGGHIDPHNALRDKFDCRSVIELFVVGFRLIADRHDALLGRRDRPFIQTANYGVSWADLGHLFALDSRSIVTISEGTARITTASAGTVPGNLDALCAASDTSWLRDGDTLWVKLVVSNSAGQAVKIGTYAAGIVRQL